MRSFADHMQALLSCTKDNNGTSVFQGVTLVVGELHLDNGSPAPQIALKDTGGFDDVRIINKGTDIEKPAMQALISASTYTAGYNLASTLCGVLMQVPNNMVFVFDSITGGKEKVFYGIVNRRGTILYVGRDDSGKKYLFSVSFSTIRNLEDADDVPGYDLGDIPLIEDPTAYNLKIGTVVGGTVADASITGTPRKQVLNLVLPAGEDGNAGPNLVSTATATDITGSLYGNGATVVASKVAITQPVNGSTLTIVDGVTLSAPANATVSGTNTGDDKTAITGMMKGLGGNQVAATAGVDFVLPGGVGVGTVLADMTLTAADLPAYPASANASTDVVTLTGHNPVNNETFYIEGETPPTITGGSYTFNNEFVGPVVYAINASGATCKLSASRGGAALDITNAGTGWTLRRAGLNKVSLAGLSEATAGRKYEVVAISPVGNAWDSVNAVSMRMTVNSQSTPSYRNSTSEGYSIIGASYLGNVQGFTRITLEHCGTYLSGDLLQHGIVGIDLAFANSVPKGTTNPIQCSYTLGTPITINSFEFMDPNGTDYFTIKVGTRFLVRRIG